MILIMYSIRESFKRKKKISENYYSDEINKLKEHLLRN